MALLELRNTPITGIEESPAQLLMNRRLRSSLPMTGAMLEPDVPQNVRTKLCQRQKQQKGTYDKSAKTLCDLKPGDVVRYKKGRLWKPAEVIGKNPNPRSYDIRTETGTILRRNRRHLRKTREDPPVTAPILDDFSDDDLGSPATNELPVVQEPVQHTERRTRSGRIVRLPLRFRDDNY